MKTDDDKSAAKAAGAVDPRSMLRELQHCERSVEALSTELQALRVRIVSLQRALLTDTDAALPAKAPGNAPEMLEGHRSSFGTRNLDHFDRSSGTHENGSRVNPGEKQRSIWTSDENVEVGAASADAVEGRAPSASPASAIPHHLEDWLSRFTPEELPVLDRTCGGIAMLRETQDDVDARELAALIEIDPMMTLKLYAHVAQVRGRARAGEPESVVGALLTLGVVPFFRAFEELRSIEAHLHARPDALEGLHAVLERSHRAAKFALAFAVHRMDPDAALLHSAALLHDVAELLLWCSEPDLAIEIRRRLRARPGLRSAEAQRLVLQVRLIELQHALMYRWRMPSRLIGVLDGHKADNQTQVRIVELSVRVARHTANGWKDPAIPDDLIEIGRLLQLAPENVRKLLIDIDRN